MRDKKRFLLMIFVLAVVLGALTWFLKDYYCLTCKEEQTEDDDKLLERSIEKVFE